MQIRATRYPSTGEFRGRIAGVDHEFTLCSSSMFRYFDLDINKRLDLVLTDEKPEGKDGYVVVTDPYNGSVDGVRVRWPWESERAAYFHTLNYSAIVFCWAVSNQMNNPSKLYAWFEQ